MNTRFSTRGRAALAWLLPVIVACLVSPLRAAADEPPASRQQDSGTQDRDQQEFGEPDQAGEVSAEEQGDTLAPLRREQLPPRTRVPPEEGKDQLVRDAVFVRIGEVIITSKGDEVLPDVQVVDIYLQEYLRRAGFTIAESPEKSRYRIEGEVFSEYYKELKVQGQTVAYKVRAECSFFVLDRDGGELESFDVPEVYRENVKSEESAFLHLRRYVAKLVWDHLRTDGEVFSDPGVTRYLAALCMDSTARDTGASKDGAPLTTEVVIARLADRGLSVVPFMLEALSDTRGVLMESSYPGLTDENRSELRVCHIADKVLEEIFQKVSRMSLNTTAKGRFRIMRGWEQEWRRFCPPFRDSPNAPTG